MNKDILNRAKNLVKEARLQALREHADKSRTFCFLTSLYEVAYHLRHDPLPPRTFQAEKEWLSEAGNTKGGVAVENIIPTLVRVSNKLGLKVDQVYATATVIPHFLGQKKAEQGSAQHSAKVSNEPVTDYLSHAEAVLSGGRTYERTEMLQVEQGWEAVIAITFSQLLQSEPENEVNVLAKSIITVEEGRIDLLYPFVLIMLKQKL